MTSNERRRAEFYLGAKVEASKMLGVTLNHVNRVRFHEDKVEVIMRVSKKSKYIPMVEWRLSTIEFYRKYQ